MIWRRTAVGSSTERPPLQILWRGAGDCDRYAPEAIRCIRRGRSAIIDSALATCTPGAISHDKENPVKKLIAILIGLSIAGCAGDNGQTPMETVMSDFGLKEKPEGYVSGSDKVYERLNEVGETEMKRMNQAERLGEVKVEEDGLQVNYYKEVKEYFSYYPLDASATSRAADRERGFVGYLEYRYRVLQGPRKPNRTEAQAESATIPTGEEGRETYRYRFASSGTWDGGKGELTRSP